MYDYSGENNESKEINNPFRESDADAPNNTIALRVEKEEKEVEGKVIKITKKRR